MLDQVLKVFEIKPDIDFDLMRTDQDLFDITSSVLLRMREVLNAHKPDVLLVHGDTTTTLAASIAAFYMSIPVGHIEAGLRTHDIHTPFPEEFNRQLTTKVSRWHFAPTDLSRQNLIAEHVPFKNITVTGNTVIDAMSWVFKRLNNDTVHLASLIKGLNQELPFEWREKRYILITGHRRENFGEGFLQICHALRYLANRYPAVHYVYPVHLNPNVQKPVKNLLHGLHNVHLIKPQDYEPFLLLLQHSYIVLTDSGGIQEEAPYFGKPVLVMRDVTERPEAIIAKTVRLLGANKESISSAVCELLDSAESYLTMSRSHNPYGDGKASQRIIDVLRGI
jgi:UDP-N-acetylglucosamine 2-epimerase (non-hydrolysing)